MASNDANIGDQYPRKSERARTLCHAHYWRNGGRGDPCDGCPLYQPCVRKAVAVPGLQAFTIWIEGINREADRLVGMEGEA